MHGRAVCGEQPDVGVFLAVCAAQQDHGHLRAQAFGDGKATGFADDQVRCRHKPCHALDIFKHRHVIGDAQVAAGPSQMTGVFRIVSRDEHEMQRVAERVQVRQQVVERRAEVHIGPWQIGSGQCQHDALVLRQPQPLTGLLSVIACAEVLARGDAGDADALLGHQARAQRFGHALRCDAEQVAGLMRPEALGLIVGGDAHDGEVLSGEHARRHCHVCRGDVRADDGKRAAFAHQFGELAVHQVRPYAAASPQKPAGKREAPRQVVYGAGRAGEHGSGFVAIEHHTAEIEHVKHFDLKSVREFRHIGKGLGRLLASFGLLDLHVFEGLRDSVRRAAMPRSHRSVHDDDQRCCLLVSRIGFGGGSDDNCLPFKIAKKPASRLSLIRRAGTRPALAFEWCPQRESNSCLSLERAAS